MPEKEYPFVKSVFAWVHAMQPGETRYVRDWGTSGTAGLVIALDGIASESPDFQVVRGPNGGIIGIRRVSRD